MSLLSFRECERARLWAALAPDQELSELEVRALRSHLRSCASCARFAQGVEHVSRLLREEELARPSLPMLLPHVVRRRQVLAARARPVAAAAAVALMALGIASRAPLEMNGRESAVRASTPLAGMQPEELASLRMWRLDTLQVDVRPLDRSALVGRNQPV
jgi:hypothetical protein